MELHPLQLSPGAPGWIVAATWPVLIVHIAAGLTGILAGFTAILARKGSPLHVGAGRLFVLSMLVMLSMGGLIAAVEPDNQGTAVGALFGIYLTVTAWSAARRPDGPVGGIERSGFWFVLIVGASIVTLSLAGLSSPHPPQPQTTAGLVMGLVALLSAAADRGVIKRGISGANRIARHLWRMSAALFFASGSFFLGQQKVMPEAVRGSPILVLLALAPLILMIFWLFYVRLGQAFKGPAARAAM